MADKNLVEATQSGDRLETLIALRDLLAARLQKANSDRDISSMSRRLMQAVCEIEMLQKERDALQNGRAKHALRDLRKMIDTQYKPGAISNERENF